MVMKLRVPYSREYPDQLNIDQQCRPINYVVHLTINDLLLRDSDLYYLHYASPLLVLTIKAGLLFP